MNKNNFWPPHECFPYNYEKFSVKLVIWNELCQSKQPLIITGYASLDMIIDFLNERYHSSQKDKDGSHYIRILLGHEPYPTERKEFRSLDQFSEEIEEYWRDEHIDIYECGKVIAAIELIKNGTVHARVANKKPIHAKIYQADDAITIGSSNFSNYGLKHQVEGNVRFTSNQENTRFKEACDLAESIWDLGRDYNDELIQLLEQLLSYVSWQKALARACAALLEGEWAKKYKLTNYLSDELQLWPSQEKGIAQALWVIENFGCVLIADATGSGKTHMGSHLIKCVMNQIWKIGRIRHDIPVLICPPAVQEAWEKEFTDCGHSVKTVSHGILSKSKSEEDEEESDINTIRRAQLVEANISAVRRAQVLAVDEAHNFLSDSQRTQTIFRNIADYILLFTATPINKGSQDLLAIIQLLGADNFDDDLLEQLKPIWKRRSNLNERMSPDIRKRLRETIQQFTVRRTKATLNRMINEEPERYKDKSGKQCRYPKHEAKTYICGETESDRAIAHEIREMTTRLLGLRFIQKITKVPEYLTNQGCTEEQYLKRRLTGAKSLAAYQIMAALRSSKAALIEYIYGTEYATNKYFSNTDQIKTNKTGNCVGKLEEQSGSPPKINLGIELPDWLSDPKQHKQACDEEIGIYQGIANLCLNISDEREKSKADQLKQLMKNAKKLIAFDSCLITLYDLKRRLEGYENIHTIIATGENQTDRQNIIQIFNPESKEVSSTIALCSDSMAEGLNLQKASAVVHLTMPSVIRLAEQRVGRVDRMDSPHSSIEVWWPKDSNEFALRSSESKFYARHTLVKDLLGANLPLPEDLSSEDGEALHDVVTSHEDFMKLEEEIQSSKIWELGDVFDPVRSLIEGKDALISKEVYEEARNSKMVSCLSFVETRNDTWAFFAIAGTEWGAPRWVYLDEQPKFKNKNTGRSRDMDKIEAMPNIITDMEEISQKIKANLFSSVHLSITQGDFVYLDTYLRKLLRHEEMLLPKKKQKALEEMRIVMKRYQEKATQEEDNERIILCRNILDIFNEVELGEPRADLSLLADKWMDLIRPHWFERLKNSKRTEPLRLRDIRKDLIEKPISTDNLRELYKVPNIKPLGKRIVAAIIGVYK